MKVGVWVPNCRHLARPEIIRSTAICAPPSARLWLTKQGASLGIGPVRMLSVIGSAAKDIRR